MNLDERLFALALKLKRRVWRDRGREAEMAHAATLAPRREHLTRLARALSGKALDIREAEGVGGCAGDVLYLPPYISITADPADNALAYVYRVAYAVTSRRLGYVLPGAGEPQAAFRTLRTLLAVPATLQALEAELPRTQELRARLFPLLLRCRPACLPLHTAAHCLEALTQSLLGRDLHAVGSQAHTSTRGWAWLQQSLLAAQQGSGESDAPGLYAQLCQHAQRQELPSVPPVVLWGQLMLALPAHSRALLGSRALEATAALPAGTERRGKPREYIRRVELDPQDIENDVLVHTFEKSETAEEFHGVTRTPDGADELTQHAAALDELDLREVVRSHVRTQSIYRADVLIDGEVRDAAAMETPPSAVFYDEWDGKARQYRKNWCSVYVTHPVLGPLARQGLAYATLALRKHAKQVRDLRIELDRIRCLRVLKNRQPDGPDIDIDALVERYATLHSGHQPAERLYLARRRQTRDLVTLVLLDMSYSTDAWIEGQRVLDVAKESVLVLGEVFAAYRDRVGIGSFYSHTRRDCRFVMVKDFDAPWQRCKGLLASLEPTGYTRIGPALRHGIHLLQQQKAARKLLLLISDGKPTDYDRYEGRYGMADVRQAIREAGQSRIHTYALAVDVQAKGYLPQMFGAGNYQILPHPSHLVRSLAQLYGRLSS